MANEAVAPELLTRLSEIESSLVERLSRLEEKLETTQLLLSDVQRYGKLQSLLAAGEWQEADLETTKAMLEVVGHTSNDSLTPEDLQTFPCNAIRVIDQLWRKYSNDHFGFSIQLQIYLDGGGSLATLRAGDLKLLGRLAETIGCRKDGQSVEYDEREFSLEAPRGGLPLNWWNSPYGTKMVNYFLMRLLSCDV